MLTVVTLLSVAVIALTLAAIAGGILIGELYCRLSDAEFAIRKANEAIGQHGDRLKMLERSGLKAAAAIDKLTSFREAVADAASDEA